MFYLEALKGKIGKCKIEISMLNVKNQIINNKIKKFTGTLTALSIWIEMCIYVFILVLLSTILILIAKILGEKFFDDNS
jgi:hypothetical protein